MYTVFFILYSHKSSCLSVFVTQKFKFYRFRHFHACKGHTYRCILYYILLIDNLSKNMYRYNLSTCLIFFFLHKLPFLSYSRGVTFLVPGFSSIAKIVLSGGCTPIFFIILDFKVVLSRINTRTEYTF